MTSEYYALIFFQVSFLTLPLVLFSEAYSDQSSAAHLRQTFFISQEFSLYPALSSQIICTVNSSCLGFLDSQLHPLNSQTEVWITISEPFFSCAENSIGNMYQFTSVAQSCPTLRPMDCSISCHPVHHQLLELAQTHVHCVGDAVQPSDPLSSPSPPAFNLSQHQGLFQ